MAWIICTNTYDGYTWIQYTSLLLNKKYVIFAKLPGYPVLDSMKIWAFQSESKWTNRRSVSMLFNKLHSALNVLENVTEFLLHTCLAKAAMSSLNDSEEQTSLWLVMPGRWVGFDIEVESRGEQVASSHFSKTRARSGNRGWLHTHKHTHKVNPIQTPDLILP